MVLQPGWWVGLFVWSQVQMIKVSDVPFREVPLKRLCPVKKKALRAFLLVSASRLFRFCGLLLEKELKLSLFLLPIFVLCIQASCVVALTKPMLIAVMRLQVLHAISWKHFFLLTFSEVVYVSDAGDYA